jgi:hypothetical protein
MDEQQFLDWLASLPGKTTQQKLNYMQDVLGTVGVDLFGTKQEPFVPDVAPVNQVEAVWGTDPGMAAVMDFIRVDRMSPKEAVDEARTQGLIPRFDPNNKGEIDYMGLASQFASEEASRPQWEAQQAQNRVKYEAGLKPTLDNMFQSPYERMGSPTVDDLLGLYGGAADRQRFMSKGSNASKITWEQPKSVKGGKLGAADVAKGALGALGQGVSRMAGSLGVVSPTAAQGAYNQSSKWAPTETKTAVPKIKIVEDKAKWARDEQQAMLRASYESLLRRNLENRIELNKRGRVATPQGEQVMRNLSILGLLNG